MQRELENTDNLDEIMRQIGHKAKSAYRAAAAYSAKQKEQALLFAAEEILNDAKDILAANSKDMSQAQQKGIGKALLDRLMLDQQRIEAMAQGLKQVAEFADPVGKVLSNWQRPNGLDIERVTVPLGVIGVIYESRPNVTADAGALCLKSGNAVILRGGSESYYSSHAIVNAMHKGIERAGLDKSLIQIVPTTSREAVGIMLGLNKYIDVIIPRGGIGLTTRISEESKIPTILHLDGNCHTYIHCNADENKAISIVENAKMRRTGICGATESIVIDKDLAATLLPKITDALTKHGCILKGEADAISIDARIEQANNEDWGKEYLDAVVSVKLVNGLEEAINHINNYSSGHTEAIITEDKQAAEEFLRLVDSSIVMQNASTQFADGGEFGMGAEIGISTGRLHARGPVGVEQLVTFKYKVRGNGQTRPL